MAMGKQYQQQLMFCLISNVSLEAAFRFPMNGCWPVCDRSDVTLESLLTLTLVTSLGTLLLPGRAEEELRFVGHRWDDSFSKDRMDNVSEELQANLRI